MTYRLGRRKTAPRGFSHLGFDSEFRQSRYWEGVVDAYIELVSRGIRDVAFPNYGVRSPDQVQWIVQRAQQAGLSSTMLRYGCHRRCPDGTTHLLGYSYQVLLFHPQAHQKAEALQRALEAPHEGQERNRLIGRLLGYGQAAIEEFIACTVPTPTEASNELG